MRYYHGTDKSFINFDLSKANSYKDFGSGIYLSEKFWHAKFHKGTNTVKIWR